MSRGLGDVYKRQVSMSGEKLMVCLSKTVIVLSEIISLCEQEIISRQPSNIDVDIFITLIPEIESPAVRLQFA